MCGIYARILILKVCSHVKFWSHAALSVCPVNARRQWSSSELHAFFKSIDLSMATFKL